MPLDPVPVENYSLNLLRAYLNAENIMLAKVAKRLAKGINQEGWAENKLLEVVALKADIIRSIINPLNKEISPVIQKIILNAYVLGQSKITKSLKEFIPESELKITKTGIQYLTKKDHLAIEVLSKLLVNNLQGTHFRILRQAEDIYRNTIAFASEQVSLGTMARREATQTALNRFASQGVTGFIDKAGKHWSLHSYAEMATRTTTGQAALQGAVNRMLDNGYDLVIVSSHGDTCPLCEPWEGEILSLSGRSDEYPSLSEAESEGLFHPNCAHTFGAYIPGLTEQMKIEPKEDRYAERQHQRYNERMIRKWKNNESVAITPEAERRAAQKVAEWQARQRDFIKKTGRARKYEREQITKAH